MQNEHARSIKRTLEVLEYFDEDHPSASVGEISRVLGYPQSSTSILLKSLMSLGYLAHDEKTRSYRPTARVALLGRGVRPKLFGDGAIMAALHDLNDRTGELIFIAVRIGLSVHYLHVVPATNALRMHLRAGSIRPAVGSATGHLLLSALDDARIARTVEAARAGSPDEPVPDLATVMADVARIRADGHVLSTHTLTPGGGVLAMLLPDPPEGEPLAICLGGVGTVIVENGDRYLAAMRDVVRRHIVNRVPA